jgi:hypothetical protein
MVIIKKRAGNIQRLVPFGKSFILILQADIIALKQIPGRFIVQNPAANRNRVSLYVIFYPCRETLNFPENLYCFRNTYRNKIAAALTASSLAGNAFRQSRLGSRIITHHITQPVHRLNKFCKR